MLAKVEWSQAEDLPPGFDELAARKYSIYPDKWREYIIILRMGKLEMWSDPVSVRPSNVVCCATLPTPV